MNKAIASAYAISRQKALEELKEIRGLENYYLYHTSIGEIYYELDNKQAAKKFYETALQLTTSQQEQQLLKAKILGCGEV